MTHMPSFSDGSPGNSHLQNASSNPKPNPTFREQGEIWLAVMAKRSWNPVRSSTLLRWKGVLNNRIYPLIGDVNLSDLNGTRMEQLIRQMAEGNLSASTIETYIMIVKMVVRSLVDADGEPVYKRAWPPQSLNVPEINPLHLNVPCFSEETMSGLSGWKSPVERMLFTLAGASGARLGELLGIEIDRHISPDFSILRIVQTLNNGVKSPCAEREIDLHSSVSRLLAEFVGDRNSGLLFRSRTGNPLNASVILRYHLHPALKELGFLNPQNNATKAGFHAFRRFRKAHLAKCGVPAHLQNFWMGHRDHSMSVFYGGMKHDRALRKYWAERCGIGFDLYS